MTLQNKISGIKIWDDANSDYVTLGDVCDTPLGPENKDCDVRSVLNYWQNQEERLEMETTDETGKTVDYRDHLQACLRLEQKLYLSHHFTRQYQAVTNC